MVLSQLFKWGVLLGDGTGFWCAKVNSFKVVHWIAKEIRRCKSRVIFFPSPNTLEEVGRGFGQLAQHEAFSKAVGAIDGYHVRIKLPKHNQLDFFNLQTVTLYSISRHL